MCGLVGVIVPQDNGFTRDQINILVGSLFINGFRGRDSTGIININTDLAAGYFKTVGDVFDLVHAKGWADMDTEILMHSKAVIGHGRAATRGTINTDNAHPFYVKNKERGGLYLVHNGTLHQNQRLPGFKEADVDSRWMAEKIAELGPEEALSVIDGPIAAMWWNDKTRRMYVFRNYERPLSFAQTPQGLVLINSETAAMMWLKHKYNLGYSLPDVYDFKVNYLYEIDIQKPKEPVIREIPKKPIIHHITHDIRQGWSDADAHDARRRNMYRTRGYTMYDEGCDDEDCAFEDASASMVEQFEKDVQGIHDGKVKKIVFINGNKVTTTEEGTSFTEVKGAYIPDLTMLQVGHNTSILQIHTSNRGKHTMKMLNKGEWRKMLRKLKVDEDKDMRKHVPTIPTALLPVPLIVAPPRNLPGGGWCVPEISPEVGKTIWFRTHTASGENVQHKALCDDWQAQFLKVYWNSRDGTFYPGQEVLVEGHTYSKVGETSCTVDGIILAKNPSPAIDTNFTTTHFGVDEAKKIANFVGVIHTIRILKADEHELTGGIVRFILNNIRSTITLNDEDIHKIHSAGRLGFDEVTEAVKLKTLPMLLKKIEHIQYPANEE